MVKDKRTIRELIERKARTDGRYAIALALLCISEQMDNGGAAGIAIAITDLSDALQRMRPMVTVETAAKPNDQ